MSRFNFQSPGAAMGDAVTQYFERRRREIHEAAAVLERRQAADDQRARFQRDDQRLQKQDQREAELDRENRADRLAKIHGPDADLPEDIAAAMRGGGYQVDSRQSLPARTMGVESVPGVVVGAQELPSQAYARRAETHTERLGREQRESVQAEKDEQRTWRDTQAKDERAFRGEQSQYNRDAAKERTDSDREMKLLIADMARSGSAETRALANEFKRLQIAGEQDKQETARTGREKAASDAQGLTQTALGHVDRLLDQNDVGAGIGMATGAYEMRGYTQGAQDFNGVKDQLVAALTQPNLGALKGPMSDKDVAFVKQLATRLDNRRLSAGETTRALQEAQAFLRSKMGGGGNGDGNGGGGNTRPTAADYIKKYGG